MKQFSENGRRFVTSRLRADKWEVVDAEGAIEYRQSLPSEAQLVDKPLLPGVPLVPQRSIDDVIAVQRRRLSALADNRRARRKGQQSRSTAKRPSKGVAAALDGLPPDLQAIALQKLSKKK